MSTASPSSKSEESAKRAQREFQTACVEHFSRLAHVFGWPKSIGQIYGLLFGSPRPLSFSDIVELLGISKGSVSQGLRTLREIGAISLATQQDRREHYVPETELRKLIACFLQVSIGPQLKNEARRLEVFNARHGALFASAGDDARVLRARLAKLQSWHRKSAAVFPFVAKFLS